MLLCKSSPSLLLLQEPLLLEINLKRFIGQLSLKAP